MAFLKKKRVKFVVDFEVNKLTDVPLLNATLFAKIRLLDGGSFETFTNHGKVEAHMVTLGPKFNFSVRIPADAQTGQLEDCRCKVSVRKVRFYFTFGFQTLNMNFIGRSRWTNPRQNWICNC